MYYIHTYIHTYVYIYCVCYVNHCRDLGFLLIPSSTRNEDFLHTKKTEKGVPHYYHGRRLLQRLRISVDIVKYEKHLNIH